MKPGSFKLLLGGFAIGVVMTVAVSLAVSYAFYERYRNQTQQLIAAGKAFDSAVAQHDLPGMEKHAQEFQHQAKLPNDANKLALLYSMLAGAYNEKGKTDEARDYYQKAVNITDSNPEYVPPKFDYEIKLAYGNFLAQIGENMEAEKYLRQSYDSAVRAKDLDREPGILNDLALVIIDEGKFPEASDDFKKVSAIYEKKIVELNKKIAWNNNNLAWGAAKNKDLATALELGKKAYEFGLESKDKDLTGASLDTIGEAYYDSGDYAQAENYYKQAVAHLAGRNRPAYAIQRKHLAMTEIKLNNLQAACESLKVSDENYKFLGSQKDLNENKNLELQAKCN